MLFELIERVREGLAGGCGTSLVERGLDVDSRLQQVERLPVGRLGRGQALLKIVHGAQQHAQALNGLLAFPRHRADCKPVLATTCGRQCQVAPRTIVLCDSALTACQGTEFRQLSVVLGDALASGGVKTQSLALWV